MDFISRITAIVVVWGAVLALQLTGLLWPLDATLLDWRFSATSRPVSGEIVFVDIDSESLAEIGVWPWPRHNYADLLDRLSAAGAAEVAFDVDFSSSSSEAEDAAFERALEDAGGYAMLAAFRQLSGTSGELTLTLPLQRFAAHAEPVIVNVSSTSGAMIRTFTSATIHEGKVLPSMAAALSLAEVRPDEQAFINYGIDAGTVARISFVDVLKGNFDPDLFEDKQVVVGASAIELRDIFAVPRYGNLPGPVLQILAAETLKQNAVLQGLGALPALLVALVLGGIVLFAPAIRLSAFIATCLTLVVGAEILALAAQAAGLLADTMGLHTCLLGFIAVRVVRELALKRRQHLEAARQRDITKTILDRVVADNFDGVVVLDESMKVIAASASAERMLEARLRLGLSAVDFLPQVMATAARDALGSEGASVPAAIREARLPFGDGEKILEYVVTRSLVHLTGEEEGDRAERRIACVTFRDITEERRSQERLAFLASHDPLTGAYSRQRFVEWIADHLTTEKGGLAGATLILIELGRMRTINNTLGHSFGDVVLKQSVMRLMAEGAAVARVGGSTFAMALDRAVAEQDIAATCSRVMDRILAPYELGGHRALIGTHAGVTTTDLSGLKAERLIGHADMALSLAKRERGNGFKIFDPAMDRAVTEKQQLETELRQAVALGQFVNFYQPQQDLKSGAIVGAEALVRWHHPERGRVPPNEFIPLAEETGTIVELGRWILVEACKHAVLWPHGTRVAVNVSPVQFELGDIPADIELALATSGLSPERLDIEITEGIFVSENGSIRKQLEKIRRLGVGVAIDDFGTGYSSLSYLGRLPVDKIKIDQSFIRNLPEDTGSAAIVQAVLDLAKSLKKVVVAEGVETEVQQALLAGLGCDIAQGYHISRPIPADDLAAFFASAEEQRRATA